MASAMCEFVKLVKWERGAVSLPCVSKMGIYDLGKAKWKLAKWEAPVRDREIGRRNGS